VTYIYRDPIQNIPVASREGAIKALSEALNVRNRASKLKRFGFSTSEDAVTWVVFTYLLRSGRLLKALQRVGVIAANSEGAVPTLLLWGAPIDDSILGETIRRRLRDICTSLGEKAMSFSEPDVIVDQGDAGLILIEVKYRSGNDFQGADYPGWNTYLSTPGLNWRSKAVQVSGCYELARNWCLLRKLANGRSATLVNLGPKKLFFGAEGARLDRFIASLDIDERTRFQKGAWTDLLGGALIDAPAWFSDYCRDRCLTD
jgi:hypothetical protein